MEAISRTSPGRPDQPALPWLPPRWLVLALGLLAPVFCFGMVAEELWNRHELRWDGPSVQTTLLAGMALATLALYRQRLRPLLKEDRNRFIWAGAALMASASLVLGYVTSDLAHHNLREVLPAELYRSGQMSPPQLADCIQTYGIQTVVNLRGSNPSETWYQSETQTAARLGVAFRDFGISDDHQVPPAEMERLARLLRDAPKPLLIHCRGGADRTALASALYLYAVAGKNPADAAEQFSLRNGHVPMLRPGVMAMDRSFWEYVASQTPPLRTVP